MSACTTAAEIWKVIQDITASQSHGRVINTRMDLATTQKGSSTVVEFFIKMKALADDMAVASKKLEDEEIASYILAGLDTDFNPVVSSMASRIEPLTLDELYTQQVSWEQRIWICSTMAQAPRRMPPHVVVVAVSPTMVVMWRRSNNSGNGGRPQNPNGDRPTCQLYGKEGHIVLRCFKRFDTSFTGPTEQHQVS